MTTFEADTGLLVSWGGFKKSVIDEARTRFFDPRLWDAGNLDQITAVYDRLPDDIQAGLPLQRIWTLLLA